MPAPDYYKLIATDRGKPETWRWYALKWIGEGQHGALVVTGGVPGVAYKSGKFKGETNWSKAEGVGDIVITRAEIDARRDRWESETGLCGKCGGDCTEVWSVGKDGTKRRPCSRCKGTGKPIDTHAPAGGEG